MALEGMEGLFANRSLPGRVEVLYCPNARMLCCTLVASMMLYFPLFL
jgi:hypothetical protein